MSGSSQAKRAGSRVPSAAGTGAPGGSAAAAAIAAYAAVAAVAALLGNAFVRGLVPAVERDRSGACAALAPERVDAGAAPPPFSLPGEDGRKRGPADFRGKVVLLNFWATWCPPCVEELPSMQRLARRMQGREFALVAVSGDDSWDEVREFFRARGGAGAITLLLDPAKETAHRYGTEKFPETYLLDRAGRVVYRFVNKRDWSSDAAIECVESFL